MKILYVITSIGTGGSESMLKNIASSLVKKNEIMIICLKKDEDYAINLRKIGINVYCLELESWTTLIKCFVILVKKILDFKPKIVHTWLYHSDLIGGLAAYFCRVPIIIWSIRSSNFINSDTSKQIKLVVWLCAKLSWFLPCKIQSCSQSGMIVHEKFGYKKDIFEYIPNGVDLSRFNINRSIRIRERGALGIEENTPIILLPARFDSIKNHADFILMAKILLGMRGDIFFIMIGEGVNNKNTFITNMLLDYKVENNFKLLGLQLEPENIMRAADIVVLTSKSEAFPNVLIEAMSCGVKCFSTDVGDASIILGVENIVPVGDMNLMANYCFDYLGKSDYIRNNDAYKLRSIVENNYDINTIIFKYEEMYKMQIKLIN